MQDAVKAKINKAIQEGELLIRAVNAAGQPVVVPASQITIRFASIHIVVPTKYSQAVISLKNEDAINEEIATEETLADQIAMDEDVDGLDLEGFKIDDNEELPVFDEDRFVIDETNENLEEVIQEDNKSQVGSNSIKSRQIISALKNLVSRPTVAGYRLTKSALNAFRRKAKTVVPLSLAIVLFVAPSVDANVLTVTLKTVVATLSTPAVSFTIAGVAAAILLAIALLQQIRARPPTSLYRYFG